ncbi:hypothetical protein ACFU9X_45505, partial [Streptomyces atratus]|uniref:hypothetical protein n=1 Tax=Streptomyces atratus TaxID=1893 RepID=UPI0036917A31
TSPAPSTSPPDHPTRPILFRHTTLVTGTAALAEPATTLPSPHPIFREHPASRDVPGNQREPL